MTGAEWLSTRFGNNKGQQLSHIVVVTFAVISVIGFIAYGFKGVGKFATIFFSYDLSFSLGDTLISSPDAYALIIIGITTLYVVKGGMYSVVGTEILQFLLMTFACFAIGYVVMTQVNAEQINESIPNGWKDLWFGWQLELDWSDILSAVDNYIATDDFNLFGLVVMLMVFKGVFASLAGPVPSYDMQRILATKSPKEAAQMSGFTICVLYMPRYLMIAGLTVLGLVYFKPQLLQMGDNIDFEMILPYAINNFIPTGVLGLILAGLMAAFMSTFAAFVNAAPAYLVNDIYKKYINPNASAKKYIYMSYVASVTIVILGVFVGFFIHFNRLYYQMDSGFFVWRVCSCQRVEMDMVEVQWTWIFLGNDHGAVGFYGYSKDLPRRF